MGRFLRGAYYKEPEQTVVDGISPDPIELTEDDEKYIEHDVKAVDELYQKALEGIRTFSDKRLAEPVRQNELTDVEKREWADRVAAMTDVERRFILTRFSTQDLYNELGARMDKDTKYINNVRETIAKYDEL